jgi:ABC-type branched-subunit amino acid transport system substrate-binding protein
VDVGVGFSDAISANIRQGRELGFKGPVLTPNTGEVATFVNLIGKEAANDVLCAVFDPGAPDTPAMTKEIARLWKEKYSKPFEISALIGWSSVWALAQAIEKAQSVDPDHVAKTWEAMKTIETPWGPGTMGGARAFGINHMVLPPVPVSRLKGGQATDTHWSKPAL